MRELSQPYVLRVCFFILLANLILIDSDDEDYFFSEFKKSISLGILQRLHLFQLLSNWVTPLEQAPEGIGKCQDKEKNGSLKGQSREN